MVWGYIRTPIVTVGGLTSSHDPFIFSGVPLVVSCDPLVLSHDMSSVSTTFSSDVFSFLEGGPFSSPLSFSALEVYSLYAI